MKPSSYSIYTQEPAPAPKPDKTRAKKRNYAIAGGTVAVLAIAASVIAMRGPSIPSANASPEKVVAYVATEGFADLSYADQAAYIDRLNAMGRDGVRQASEGLDRDAQRQISQNVREAHENQRMEAYFALPIGPERNALLDKQIDEMAERMAEFANRGGGQRGGPGGGGQRGGPGGGSGGGPGGGEARQGGENRGGPPGGAASRTQRMKSRIENSNSTRRAQRDAYRQAMRDRMQERGINTPFSGRGGR